VLAPRGCDELGLAATLVAEAEGRARDVRSARPASSSAQGGHAATGACGRRHRPDRREQSTGCWTPSLSVIRAEIECVPSMAGTPTSRRRDRIEKLEIDWMSRRVESRELQGKSLQASPFHRGDTAQARSSPMKILNSWKLPVTPRGAGEGTNPAVAQLEPIVHNLAPRDDKEFRPGAEAALAAASRCRRQN